MVPERNHHRNIRIIFKVFLIVEVREPDAKRTPEPSEAK